MTEPRRELWKFWTGQTLSQLGSSFTAFAMPLLVYKHTGSALDLGIAAAINMVPYLLFGLVLGAWVDRKDRKRLMIVTDLARGAAIATIPVLAMFHAVPVYWLYGVGFVSSTLTIVFEACEFAALPSLATGEDLVVFNGRIQASYAGAAVAGPFLAGVLLVVVPVPALLVIDAATFVISAVSLMLVRTRFNAEDPPARPGSVLRDVREGLRYVLGNPVLRGIAIMMALMNLLASAANSQLVLLLKTRWQASDAQVGWFYAAAGLGMVGSALLAGPLRKRLPFSAVALGALAVSGAAICGVGVVASYWVALALWTVCAGAAVLYNVVVGSLRQAIAPNEMLGRVMTTASVLAWSTIPIGSLASGYVIERSGSAALAYVATGAAMAVVAVGFVFTAVGRAERYVGAPAGRL